METYLTLGSRTGHTSELPRLLQGSASHRRSRNTSGFPEAMFPEPPSGRSQGASHASRAAFCHSTSLTIASRMQTGFKSATVPSSGHDLDSLRTTLDALFAVAALYL